MRRSTAAWLVGTHVLALGLGIVFASRSDDERTKPSLRPVPKISERPSREKRQVSTGELLSAYNNFDFISEARARRKGPNEIVDASSKISNEDSPEDRAAQVDDISASLDEQLDAVNGGKSYDYQFSKALIKRWLLEDPAACMKWVGSMKMQVGWGDPFNAIAEALPAEQLLDLMDESWLSRNRNRALESIAETVGSSTPEKLGGLLARLSEGEASVFLSTAMRNAKPEDAGIWLKFALETQPSLVSTLAMQWLGTGASRWEWRDDKLVQSQGPFNKGDWAEKARMVLAAAEGTAAEEEIRQRYTSSLIRAEEERLLALAIREPNNAYDQMMALHQSSGNSSENLHSEVINKISNQFGHHADQWKQGEWEMAIQQNVLGELPMDRVISERLDLIRKEIPESFRAPLQEKALVDALRVDPSAAIRIGMENRMKADLINAAYHAIFEDWQPYSTKARMVLEMDRAGLWRDARNMHDGFASMAKDFLLDDPDAARTWKAQLSPEALKTLEAKAP